MSSHCEISIPAAALMLAEYARMNGISGSNLVAIFDVGMVHISEPNS